METPPRVWRWVKANPLSAFILLSVGVHLLLIGLTARRPREEDPGPELIRFDLREQLPEEIPEELPPEPLPPPEEEPPAPEPPPLPEPPPPAVPPVALPAAEVILPAEVDDFREEEERPRTDLPDYIASLQSLIDREIEYPPLASRQRREGEVMVVFTLRRDGRLLNLSVAPGGQSPFEPFNREALRAVTRAAPYFRPFPESIPDRDLTFRLPIVFSLR